MTEEVNLTMVIWKHYLQLWGLGFCVVEAYSMRAFLSDFKSYFLLAGFQVICFHIDIILSVLKKKNLDIVYYISEIKKDVTNFGT